MTSTTEQIAAAIDHSNREWEEGRMCSPDQRDYVLDAMRVMQADLSEKDVQMLATEIYEDAGETMVTSQDIAKYIYQRVHELLDPTHPASGSEFRKMLAKADLRPSSQR